MIPKFTYIRSKKLMEIAEYLSYAPETGIFTWIKKPNRNIPLHKVAGCLSRKGYIQIRVLGKIYYAHRLAWAFTYGYLPEEQIDHINRIKSDNRLINLRACDNRLNQENVQIKANNTSGFKGVTFSKDRGKWKAQFSVNKTQKHIGYFKTPEEAHEAYKKEATKAYGEFYCDA